MVTVQDLLITMSVGSILCIFLFGMFGAYSPSLDFINDKYNPQLESIKNKTSDLTKDLTKHSQKVEVNPDPVSALASALGGIAVLTLKIAQLLLSVIIELPKTFLGIVFGIIDEGGTMLLENDDPLTTSGYGSLIRTLQEVITIAITIILVVGIIFNFILGKSSEIG